MYAAILAGGKGKRFWPFSRAGKPKQFLDITGGGSMLSLTYRRLVRFIPPEKVLLLTVEDQLPSVRKELPELPDRNIFVEPAGRNTAPSLAVAASMALARDEDEPMLCCPSDHLITNTGRFRKIAEAAGEISLRQDVLVTLGITPDRPATGYGYIESGEQSGEAAGVRFLKVSRFHEKPDADKAAEYVKSGEFYWNSGIFCWRPSVFISAWERFLPAGTEPLRRISEALSRGGEGGTIGEEYSNMPAISVDYGILEKAGNVVVAPADLGWSDVGSWDALFDILERDDRGNVAAGETELLDASGNLLFNPGGTIAAVGVSDLIVVVQGDTVLVVPRGESQRVKELIEKFEREGKTGML